MAIGAIFADQIAPYKYDQVFTGPQFGGPSADHLLGTDRLGRDEFSRILYGARISLAVGFLAVSFGTIAGTTIGMISGYLGGWVDAIMQRLIEITMAIPFLILAFVFVTAFGKGQWSITWALAIGFTPGSARVMRGVALQLKAKAYVEAAAASGASSVRVVWRHIVPNALDEVLVLGSIALGAAIIAEASLSFLGLGVQDPKAEWGWMLSDSRLSYRNASHLIWAPALAISLAVLSVNMLGDAVRDILDPRLRGRGKVNLN
jgi:peptide/nickel transport system permease protein